MIIDRLENHCLYLFENSALRLALSNLTKIAAAPPAVGRYEEGDDRFYYMVQQYDSRPLEKCMWESHLGYIDIQYIVSGHERMGFANKQTLRSAEYFPERDFQSYDTAGSVMYNLLDVLPGQFTIFFPEDAHMPGIFGDEGPAAVTKIVYKVKVSG